MITELRIADTAGQGSRASAPLIEAIGVSRSFGAVRALDGVSLEFRSGEVHGLVGANGAGKSTLLNILAGSFPPSAGTIRVDGHNVAITSPREADRFGFAFIHQELALVPDFSAIDNITLGMSARSRFGLPSERARATIARDVADRIGIGFDLTRPVKSLSPAERGMVAIGRALARDSRFIAMDEPTASLSDVECARLFELIRELARQGVGIAYVSHRLREIEDLSDRVTVFKDGLVTGRFERGAYTREDLISGITGTTTIGEETARPAPVPPDNPILISLEHVSDGGRVRDVSFCCRAGEVVGLAGVVGAGRSEALELIFGARLADQGTMTLRGKPFSPKTESHAISQGIALVPEERRSQALLMDDSISTNIALGNWRSMRAVAGLPFVSDRHAEEVSGRMLRALDIKADGTDVIVRKLSGGNQQKVVLARWLARNSTVLLLDEPTRGVDVGARRQIWNSAEEFARAGNAVVVVSSELEELAICDRIIVMVEGRTVAELAGPGVTEEQMLSVIYMQDHKIKECR